MPACPKGQAGLGRGASGLDGRRAAAGRGLWLALCAMFMAAYVCGDARGLAGPLSDVSVRCSGCVEASRAGRLCRCGQPPSYRTTTGKSGPCVWNGRPREGPVRDVPIPCRCRACAEATRSTDRACGGNGDNGVVFAPVPAHH